MDNLLKHLRQPGWELRLGLDSLIIYVPDELAANELLEAADQLAQSVAKLRFSDALIRWQGALKPLRVVASMAATPSDDETLEAAEQVLDDSADMQVLAKLLNSGMNALVELESDDAVVASSTLLRQIGQTSSEYRHDNMRRYWLEDLGQPDDSAEPEYLTELKRDIRQGSAIANKRYEAWLNDFEFCRFRSDFELVYFQGVACRLATIHEITPVMVPA